LSKEGIEVSDDETDDETDGESDDESDIVEICMLGFDDEK